jgi:hypothetical protein
VRPKADTSSMSRSKAATSIPIADTTLSRCG